MKAARAYRLVTPFQGWMGLLLALMAAGGGAGLLVFIRGLSVTNLNDLVPWGLWITIDLSSIALSAGAFSLCAGVYLLGLREYQPIARTATFIGLIGYSMAMLCLLMDIGRPERFWHGFVFWNPHSVLWEVTMCVGLYFSVLSLETLPILGEAAWMRYLAPRLSAWMRNVHRLAPLLAVAGLCLSMLHQSSLGATYGVLKARPVWFRPGLPVLFMISAVAGGIAMTLLASSLAARFTPRARLNQQLVEKLARFVGWTLLLYLYMRFWDVFAQTYTNIPGRTEGLQMLTQGALAFNFWVGELLLGALIPAVILLIPRLRAQPQWRILAFLLAVGGLVAYRWDVNMVGQLVLTTYQPQEALIRYTTYTPSIVETLAGIGVVAFGLFAFTLGVRYLNIVDARQGHP